MVRKLDDKIGMEMIKIEKYRKLWGVLACVLVFLTACSKDIIDTSYIGSNGAQTNMPSAGFTLKEGSLQPVTVKVSLPIIPTVDTELGLEWVLVEELADPNDVFDLSTSKLNFKAGERSSSFTVKTREAKNLVKTLSKYELKLVPPTNNDQQIKVENNISFVVSPADEFPELTPQQLERMENSPANIGIWTGLIDVKVDVTRFDGGWFGFSEGGRFSYKGKSIIVPSETNESLATLDIKTNAFGLEEYFYMTFRGETIDIAGDPYNGFNKELLDYVGWTRQSTETFKMALKDLVFIPDSPEAKKGKIKFSFYNNEYEEYVVPFLYDFSARNRLKKLIDEGDEQAIHYGDELLDPDFTLDSYPSEDGTTDGTGTYNEETGVLTFTIRLTHSYAAETPDFITVTYTSPQVAKK